MKNVSIANGSQYHEQSKQFKDSKLFNRLQEKYRVKPYYEQNKKLKIGAVVSSYLFNTFSILIGFFFAYSITKTFLGAILGAILSIAILTIIEAFKRLILPPIAKNYLQFNSISYPRLLIAISLISLSAFLSYEGGNTAIHSYTNDAKTVNTDSIKAFYTNISRSKQEQQQQLAKVKYKGTTTRTAQKAINAIQQEINTIRSQENEVLSNAIAKNSEITEKNSQQKYTNGLYFSLIALIFDLSLIFCLVYVEYYDYNSLAEFATLGDEHTATVPPLDGPIGGGAKKLKSKELTNDSKTIAQTAKKQCLNCSNEFEASNKKKKFCSTTCRVKHWEQENKKKLTVPTT